MAWTLLVTEALAKEYRQGLATIQSGEARAGAARFKSGAGSHGKFLQQAPIGLLRLLRVAKVWAKTYDFSGSLPDCKS